MNDDIWKIFDIQIETLSNQLRSFRSILSFFETFIHVNICLSSEYLTKNQNKLALYV